MAIASLIAVAGCSTAPKPATPSPPAPGRPGGFYQDDGPPAQVPADIMATPDAVPRIEPFHSGASRPYVALGNSYTPITDDRALVQRGYASWYGRQFHGNRTSTGEIYDMFAMTAAHPTMPLPSYARVTNLRNGASVVVRVNDRGPFRDGRVIDLSYAAAVRLGIAATGTGEVEVRRITHREIAGLGAPAVAAAPPPAPSSPPRPATAEPPVAASNGRWAVQLGAFAAADRAQELLARVQAELAKPQAGNLPVDLQPRIESDGGLHRVLLGALPEREAAATLATRLAALLGGGIATYVVLR
ncbi:MAG: septal ring lytic transglycosylase RlpA family protein [Burkholderiales bacterium]|jgi:rare lipoprotein A|nr:septal ring lytic transglycosylase RlpA family protein [Burkholderiales bacterium]